MQSNYVKMSTIGNKIIICATPVKDEATYRIEFENSKIYNSLFNYGGLIRRFDGLHATRATLISKSTGKVYVDVKFLNKKTLDTQYDVQMAEPWFKIVLTSNDSEIAQDIFDQLTEQALAYENVTELQNAL